MFPGAHARAAHALAKEPDPARPHDRRRHPHARRRDRVGHHRAVAARVRASPYDVRKAFPYCGYEQYEFDVPTRTEGDAYARFMVRLDEMDQSMRIVEQARKQLDDAGTGDDRRHEIRAAAERDDRALDGSADPSLQDRQRRRSAFRRATSTKPSRVRAASSATTSSPTATTGRGACARGRRRCTTCKCSSRSRPATSSPTWS